MKRLLDTMKMVRYVSDLDTSQVSRPRWGRRALLALCVLAVICVTPAQIAEGDWMGRRRWWPCVRRML